MTQSEKRKAKSEKLKSLGLSILCLFLVFAPVAAFGQNFCRIGGQGLVKVPCLFDTADEGIASRGTFGDTIVIILDVALMVVGSLAVLFLMWGGLRYLTARGNEEATEAAKKTLTNAIVGLIVVVLAFTMIRIITNILIFGSPF